MRMKPHSIVRRMLKSVTNYELKEENKVDGAVHISPWRWCRRPWSYSAHTSQRSKIRAARTKQLTA